MNIAIMQPYFFPYLPYWQLIGSADRFVLLDDVRYRTRSFITRNSILLNGRPQLLTLEVLGASQNRNINDIEVGGNRGKLLKTIRHAYGKAPFHDLAMPVLEEILNRGDSSLPRFLRFQIETLQRYLGIATPVCFSSEIPLPEAVVGDRRLMEICRHLKASRYVNPIGGVALYDRSNFRREGIELRFLKSTYPSYRQFDDGFIANLSIIDAIMFNHPDNIRSHLGEYELV